MSAVPNGGLGFACNWDPAPQRTWSGTAWYLWQALSQVTDCPDVGVHLPHFGRRALQGVTRRRRNGSWVSTWEHTHVWQEFLQARVQRNVRAAGCASVLEIQDIAIVDRPFFIYQDFSYDILAAQLEEQELGVREFFRTLDEGTLTRRRERQRAIYQQASGVIAMSQWFATSLIEDSGLPPGKVFVAYPGATSVSDLSLPLVVGVRPNPRRRLLFLGTSFRVKGGETVLRALELVRAEDSRFRLTVAGPRTWPLDGSPPDGVDFIGAVPRSGVAALLDNHDLLVMPSRLEGFGIVFVEALARGLPCIGRNAYAMPEIIEDGVTGALVDSDTPEVLAETILRTLKDDSIFEEVARRAPAVAEKFSWSTTAQTILEVVQEASPA